MRTPLLMALCLALPAQDKGTRRIEWKLATGKTALYQFLDKGGKPIRGQEFLLFGSELSGSGNRIVVDKYEDLPIPFVFRLPPDPFKTAAAWEHASPFFHESGETFGVLEAFAGGGGFRPVFVRGGYGLKSIQKKADDEIAVIDGAFTFFEVRRDMANNQTRFTVTKNDIGTLATSVQVSVPRGLLLKAGWQMKVKGQERIADARGGTRVVDRLFTTHEVIELREEGELDPAKISASAEGAVKKAIDWLRKQQKPSGAWGAARPPDAPGEAISHTGLVVRALLACGVPPDDPAIASAVKSLRTAAPAETTALARQIAALSIRGPATPQEGDEIVKLAEELLRRREARTGLWSAGGRADAPPSLVATAQALEALALAPGAKVPDEAWKAAFDHFIGATIDEEKEIDLELEFEKDAATFPLDPKKAIPLAWMVDAGGRRPGAPARRGSYFIQVAGLHSLLIAAGKLTLDPKQKQAADLALRRGFAGLQARWTVRTVPPVEAAWCHQRIEYFGWLAPMLSRAKVDRIARSDWRLEAATMLMREQGDDGSWWPGTDPALTKTAYALLLLGSVRKP